MKAYLLRLLSVSLLTAVLEFLLPHGSVRKFVSPLLSLLVTAAVLLPAAALFSADGESLRDLFPEAESVISSASYETAVREEYARRIETEIEKRGEADAEVFADENFSIKRIVLSGNVTTRMMIYIQTELEVPRNLVEIR